MKMKYLIGLAVLVALAGSCKKNENTDTTTFIASIENDEGNGKTWLDDMKVKWSTGDQIIVYGNGDNKTYELSSGANTQMGTFIPMPNGVGGVQPADVYRGFYPASNFSSLSGDIFTFTMPATQTYVPNSFDNNLNPMAGKATGGSTTLLFRNAFSVLKITATGNDCPISSVELTTTGSDYALSGTFVFNYASRTTTLSSGTGNKITMDVGTTLTSAAQSFYFVVPPQALANGFTVTFKNGNTTIGSDVIITAAQVTSNYTLAPNKIFQLGTSSTPLYVEARGIKNLVPNVTKDTWWTSDGNGTKTNTTYNPSSSISISAMMFRITSHGEVYIRPNDPVKLIKGHSYYVRFYTMVNDYGGNTNYDFFWPENSNTQIIANSGQGGYNNTWKRHSAIVTNWAASVSSVSNNTDYYPRIDINALNLDNQTHERYVAGVMLIDLTDAQAKTGINYPGMSKDELDGKAYFYGITPSW